MTKDKTKAVKKDSFSSANNLKLTPQKSSFDDSNLDEPVRVVRQVTTSLSTLKDILNYCF